MCKKDLEQWSSMLKEYKIMIVFFLEGKLTVEPLDFQKALHVSSYEVNVDTGEGLAFLII